jgi:hypothetical protein
MLSGRVRVCAPICTSHAMQRLAASCRLAAIPNMTLEL